MEKLKKAVDNYIKSAIINGEESEKGNYKLANKNYKINYKNHQIIISYNEEGYDELIRLLNHANHHVKIAAAYHLLNYSSELATDVLRSLINEPKGIGFKAKMILSEWKEGNL